VNFYSNNNRGLAVPLKSVCCPVTADLQIDNVYDTVSFEPAVYDNLESVFASYV